MLSKHFNIPLDASQTIWNYFTVALNITSNSYSRPFTIIISNKSTTNMIFTIYSKKEFDEDTIAGSPRYENADDGILVKGGGQLQLTKISDIFRIGARLELSGSANSCVISCMDYGEQRF